MIDRNEILALANETGLTPHVVEKDYMLGWLLAGIFQQEEFQENWVLSDQCSLGLVPRIWRTVDGSGYSVRVYTFDALALSRQKALNKGS